MKSPNYQKIFKRNIVDRYIDRPITTSFGDKFGILDTFCFSALSSYYYLSSKPKYKENDYQPEEPDDEVVVDMSHSMFIPNK